MVVQSIESIDSLMMDYWTIALLARFFRGKRPKVLSTLVGRSRTTRMTVFRKILPWVSSCPVSWMIGERFLRNILQE